jgi:hypothetical protein
VWVFDARSSQRFSERAFIDEQVKNYRGFCGENFCIFELADPLLFIFTTEGYPGPCEIVLPECGMAELVGLIATVGSLAKIALTVVTNLCIPIL